MRLHVRRKYLAILTGSKVILLLILLGFQLVQLLPGSSDLVAIHQNDIQIARVEYIVKDAEILVYRPQTFHSQAMNELQIVLPQFVQVQNGLLNGDTSLGLPLGQPEDQRQMVLAMAPEYNAIVSAVKVIISHPDQTPPRTEVDIILDNEQKMAISLFQLEQLKQQRAEQNKPIFIGVEGNIIGITLLDILLGYFFLIRPLTKESDGDAIPSQATSSLSTKPEPSLSS